MRFPMALEASGSSTSNFANRAFMDFAVSFGLDMPIMIHSGGL